MMADSKCNSMSKFEREFILLTRMGNTAQLAMAVREHLSTEQRSACERYMRDVVQRLELLDGPMQQAYARLHELADRDAQLADRLDANERGEEKPQRDELRVRVKGACNDGMHHAHVCLQAHSTIVGLRVTSSPHC
jgi:hypothetical protein